VLEDKSQQRGKRRADNIEKGSSAISPVFHITLLYRTILQTYWAFSFLVRPTALSTQKAIMPRQNATNWSRREERNLERFLWRYRKLSWKARSRVYYRRYRISRSGESLRGKQNELRRRYSIDELPALSIASDEVRRQAVMARRWRACSEPLAPLPVIVLRAPDLEILRTLELFRQLRLSSKRPTIDALNLR
jgi:hypothetical protein